MISLSLSDFLRGIPAGRLRPRALRAGPLRLLLDPSCGSIRSIRAGRIEAVRGIYAAVRDRNWGTIEPEISGLRIEEGPRSFRAEFRAACRRGEIDFEWKGTVEGRPDGSVVFAFDGIARSSFLRNRIGICLLHPAAVAGSSCAVEHIDGGVEAGAFPRLIAPHQPFRAIRAIRHETEPGVSVEVRLEGETFEMEDQRNWTDASFKTYSPPLDLPFPVRVAAGERIRQGATVRAIGMPRDDAAAGGGLVEVTVGEDGFPLPPIGLGVSSGARPLSEREAGRLRRLRLTHLRADIRPGEAGWGEALAAAAGDAASIGARLHAALHLTDRAEAEIGEVAAAAARIGAPVALWLVFRDGAKATDPALARLALERLGTTGIPVAAGTDFHFAELNRSRPEPGSPALPCFSANPQVHAFDPATLVENLDAGPAALETAASFSRGPVVISPITLRPRLHPEATGEIAIAPGDLPPSVDPRRMSLFGAGWTVGSIAALAGGGRVHSLTYFETTGWRGVMERDEGSPLPEKFPSVAGAPFPVFHALAWIAGLGRVLPAVSSDPSRVQVLALEGAGGRRRIIIADVSGDGVEVRLRAGAGSARAVILDETSAADAALDPEGFQERAGGIVEARGGTIEILLGPCALARVDLP